MRSSIFATLSFAPRLQEGLWNGGQEVFGHEYFSTFNDRNLDECARMAGVNLDFLKKKTFTQPSEGTSSGKFIKTDFKPSLRRMLPYLASILTFSIFTSPHLLSSCFLILPLFRRRRWTMSPRLRLRRRLPSRRFPFPDRPNAARNNSTNRRPPGASTTGFPSTSTHGAGSHFFRRVFDIFNGRRSPRCSWCIQWAKSCRTKTKLRE